MKFPVNQVEYLVFREERTDEKKRAGAPFIKFNGKCRMSGYFGIVFILANIKRPILSRIS
jgi:hypothetical protein